VLTNVVYGCESWSLILREAHRLVVFGNRVLRPVLEPKREEVMGCCRRVRDELHKLYAPPDIITSKKLRNMRWTRHVACMRKINMHTEILAETLKGNDQLQNVGIHRSIMLEWILDKSVGKVWTRFIWIMTGTNGGLFRTR
jgi:hypothetical protein